MQIHFFSGITPLLVTIHKIILFSALQNAGAQAGYQIPSLLGKPIHKNAKTRSSNAKSGSMVDTYRRSGLASIYKAPRNLDQIGAGDRITKIKCESKVSLPLT